MIRRPRGDVGFSLIETVTGMFVMGVFMAIFSAAMITIYGSSNRSEAVAQTQQQLDTAFTRLDGELRYASYISTPGQDAQDGDWYVEFQNAAVVPSVCTQLRIDKTAQQLQQRTWTGTGPAGAWQPLAVDVVNGAAAPGANQPFTLTAASSLVQLTQLTVNLLAAQGGGSDQRSSQSTVTFTALNTSTKAPKTIPCTGMRP